MSTTDSNSAGPNRPVSRHVGTDPAGAPRVPRRRERVATVSLLVGVGAALAAVTLSGCGIRSTAVPVDAGLPASRTACPPSPEPSGTQATFGSGPGALPSAAATFALPGVVSPSPSETPWEVLTSALPELAASVPADAGSSTSAGAEHRSAVPSPHATRSARSAATPAPARSGTSGFSVESCSSASTSGTP